MELTVSAILEQKRMIIHHFVTLLLLPGVHMELRGEEQGWECWEQSLGSPSEGSDRVSERLHEKQRSREGSHLPWDTLLRRYAPTRVQVAHRGRGRAGDALLWAL